MKAIVLLLAAMLLAQFSTSLSCSAGWYDPGTPNAKCMTCASGFGEQFVSCAATPAVTATLRTQIAGAGTNSASFTPNVAQNYCPANTYYDKTSNNCELLCKLGCASCVTDVDFCTDCTSGFYWNSDYTCLPAGVGLLAASLAFLVIGLVFLIATCCLVNKSRK